jgi:hypothetical protein
MVHRMNGIRSGPPAPPTKLDLTGGHVNAADSARHPVAVSGVRGQYDLIFIDALHEEAQCLRDIENASKRLSANGCIVVHDTNQPTEQHQQPVSHYRLGEEWNSTAWKAVVRFRHAHPDIAVVTLM